MAFGRVFATYPNVGIVTFEPDGPHWSVRHVIGGELLPLADTGVNPTGPAAVPRAPLHPGTGRAQHMESTSARRSWPTVGGASTRPDPTLTLLFNALPLIWKGAAEFAGGLFDALPPVIDDVTREGLLADAASRVSTPFRRRVLARAWPVRNLR